MGNPNAKGQIGNRGGGRLGYVYEKDQLVKFKQLIDRALARIQAYEEGKITEAEIKKYAFSLPIVLKAMDKLHPNKQQINIPLGGDDDKTNLSELTFYFRAVAAPPEQKQLNDGTGTGQPGVRDSEEAV